MLNELQIKRAKKEVTLQGGGHYEHDDCIRIAYEWLDAQKKTKNIRKVHVAQKSLIECWAGRYVSQSDVEIAAHIHPDIIGSYPFYNLSSRRTEPSISRLKDIEQAFTQHQNDWHKKENYQLHE